MTKEEAEQIENILEDCNEARSCSNSPFNKWEEDFIDSINEQFDEKRRLTSRQVESLKNIWDKI